MQKTKNKNLIFNQNMNLYLVICNTQQHFFSFYVYTFNKDKTTKINLRECLSNTPLNPKTQHKLKFKQT